MTERELKKLRRADLLEMLITLSKENEKLRKELTHAKKLLAKRTIVMKESGSIAEAALRLNGVFEAAQAAADQYLESLRCANEGNTDEKDEEQ